MTYQPYVSCTKCSGKAQPGTVALLRYVMDRFPRTGSLGVYNCRAVAGSTSLSQHACGRAADSKIPTTSTGGAITSIGNPVVQFLDKYSTEFGITQQIYNRIIYDLRSPRGRYYGGVHPHYDHVHWAQTPTKALSLTYDSIVGIAGPPTAEPEPTPSGEPMLSVTPASSREDIRLLQLRLNGGFNAGLTADGIYGTSTANAVKTHLLGFTSADPADPEITAGKEVNAAMWDGLEVTHFKKKMGVGTSTVDQVARDAAKAADQKAVAAQNTANTAKSGADKANASLNKIRSET